MLPQLQGVDVLAQGHAALPALGLPIGREFLECQSAL